MLMPRPRTLWMLLAAVVVLTWVAVGIPTWHIQPFKPQTDDGMAWSYALRDWGPFITGVGVALAAGLAVLAWRTTRRRWTRLAATALAALSLAPAWFVRQNHFEWMFAPLDEVAYAAVADAGFLSDAEMVMGLQVGGESVAFPVRQLAYHHLVNTEIGGEPLVATY
jgi:peptidoglycan/LPS O-acetylase OafA/YrhL